MLVTELGSVSIGNPVQVRDCPAAVSENQIRLVHWRSRAPGSDGK